jgi:hypothetical protein
MLMVVLGGTPSTGTVLKDCCGDTNLLLCCRAPLKLLVLLPTRCIAMLLLGLNASGLPSTAVLEPAASCVIFAWPSSDSCTTACLGLQQHCVQGEKMRLYQRFWRRSSSASIAAVASSSVRCISSVSGTSPAQCLQRVAAMEISSKQKGLQDSTAQHGRRWTEVYSSARAQF